MTRTRILIAAALVAAILTVTPDASANPPDRPLGEEPTPLSIDPDQVVFLLEVVPGPCAVLAGGVPQCIEHWVCPAGRFGTNPLSLGARQRLAPSYNAAILLKLPALAYRDTHCEYRSTSYPAPAVVPAPTAPAPVVPVARPAFTG